MPWLSPPVPTISTASGGASTVVMRARRNFAAPVISSIVSPRTRKRHQECAHRNGRRDARHQQIERGLHFRLAVSVSPSATRVIRRFSSLAGIAFGLTRPCGISA